MSYTYMLFLYLIFIDCNLHAQARAIVNFLVLFHDMKYTCLLTRERYFDDIPLTNKSHDEHLLNKYPLFTEGQLKDVIFSMKNKGSPDEIMVEF